MIEIQNILNNIRFKSSRTIFKGSKTINTIQGILNLWL